MTHEAYIKRMEEIKLLSENFGCFTGDCPHEKQIDCYDAVKDLYESDLPALREALADAVYALTKFKDAAPDVATREAANDVLDGIYERIGK